MTRILAITWLLVGTAFSTETPDDLLRFTNGDQLHGGFRGIRADRSVIWQRGDVEQAVDFKPDGVRHVILRGGRPARSLAEVGHVAMVNGDRIPGKALEMDERSLVLETEFAGVLKLPRNQVALFAPNPLGGRLRYHGPFNEDDWKMAHASFPDGMPAPKTGAEDDAAKDAPGRWEFSGSGWFWKNKGYGTAIIRENALPDRAILRFDLAWRNRLSVAIGFHADLAKAPEKKDQENDAQRRPMGFVPGDSAILPKVFGNSYVLQIFSMQTILYRTSVADDGSPSIERVQINGSGPRLGDTGKVTVEIRSNRDSGVISLFMDDEFVARWDESEMGNYDRARFAGKGDAFGFVVQTEDSPVKISDVMVAEWNGMPDSARSMQTDEQDIVLLTNGTDRYSGKVERVHDGKVDLAGKYGRFSFELGDVAEIRFARKSLAKRSDTPEDNLVVEFSPLGQISGQAVSGDQQALRMSDAIYGEFETRLESAVMLDFHPSDHFIDDWDAVF